MNIVPTNPIMMEICERFESKRLVIRAPLWGDGKAMNEAIRESIEELQPWMPWAQSIPTVDESEANLRQARLQFLERKDMRLLLIHKDSGQIVGSSGLHNIDWDARKFEIGYWVRTSFAKQGYVTEAVHAITSYTVEQLQANRIEIRCDERNTRSAQVATRAGFTLEGTLRNDSLGVDGSTRSTLVYSKVRGVEY